jgi:hypothetical protein
MAQYFTYFPKMYYDAVQDGTTSPKLVTDLLRRVKVRDGLKNQTAIFNKYQVVAGETILLMNNIKDRFYEWPLSEQQFEAYVNGKYTNPQGVHHYEITQSSGPTSSLDNSHVIEVNSTTSGAQAVSNYTYERRLQDNKSLIKVLKREYLSQFVEEFAKLVRS